MPSFIEKIQRKPLWYRRRVLLLTTVGLTAIVFIIWFSTLGSRLSELSSGGGGSASALAPLLELKESAVAAYGTVYDALGTFKGRLFSAAPGAGSPAASSSPSSF